MLVISSVSSRSRRETCVKCCMHMHMRMLHMYMYNMLCHMHMHMRMHMHITHVVYGM